MNWKAAQIRLGVKADGQPGPMTYAALLAHAGHRAVDATVQAAGNELAKRAVAYGLTSAPRLCEFVAQITNETGGLRRFEENLNYSAEQLMKCWPTRFKAPNGQPNAAARELAHYPEAIANAVYGNRMGNTQPGDGWRFRGRGALQLTGRANYARYGAELGIDLIAHPERAAEPATSLLIALLFFKNGNVNAAVDKGDFAKARQITNGGSIGLGEVAVIRERLLALFA